MKFPRTVFRLRCEGRENMLRFWRSTVLLLLCLQCVCASGSSRCETPEGKCDFVCDCSDCSDEQNCGFSGKTFECDFEDEGVCGWKIESVGEGNKWQRVQSGDGLPESGPTSDFTTGTATGWFMSVSAVGAESLQSSVLISPEIKGSSPTCRLRLRYFLWDSGHTGLGPTPLWASILHQDSQEAIVWRPEASSARSWREATVFLGRISSPFRIHLHSARSAGQNGDVAIDQLEFLDCALPSPPAGNSCPAGTVACGGGGCVEQRQVCDGSDDCGDGSDEARCDDYYHCDFEEGLCDWDLRSISKLKWIRTNQENISRTDPWKGPGRDHSNNTASGYFLYVTVPDGGLTMDWAAFQSPRLQPTNSSHPCKMVMYTHQFGPRSGGLTVLVADRLIYPVWERGGALGDLWVKAEVEIVSNYTFQILIMAAIRDLAYGGIAIDSIVLSPECRWSSDNTTLEKIPKPPKHPCIDDPEKMCDFQADCDAAEDEAKCGDFSYLEGSSGWTDTSIGSQGWLLDKNSTTEEFLYVAEAAGQQLTEAQIRTPLLGPTGPACNLSFDFALTGSLDHIGELSVRVIDSLLGVRPKLWEFSGKTGAGDEEETWQHVDLPIGVRKHRFQLAFEARAMKVQPFAWIKVRNVRFISCHADYTPSLPTGASCNFEDGLCAWYQDNSDNFDWSVVTGMDHSIGVGTSLVVDMWSPSLRGAFGRLLSFPQRPTPTERCLTFYYKLYGPNAGALNVKLTDGLGYEILLWTRAGAHGNEWHEAHCPVPQQRTSFQLIFEAVRSGFDGQVAIDDVAFVDGPCSIPRRCSFEGQKCGYTSYGAINWLHRNGHTTTMNGPKTDHTLGTELGYYMMVNTDADILPPGSAAVLVSPVQQGTTRPECVSFWYHMTGGNPAFFTVYVKPQKGQRVPIFSENLNEGDDWRHVNGNISVGLASWQLEFEVVGSGSRGSHVAVDDITVSAHPCEDQGSKCSLENGMCSWINIQDRKRDKLDWELTSPEKEKHYPVPPEDHTLRSEKGHFLFFPSSNRTAANQNAWLVSPQLPPVKPTCLRFWAYKPQSSDCQLKVLILSGGIINQQLILNDLSGHWRQFEHNITFHEGYQIVFEGIKGTSGFVALDDIEFTVGLDCATRVTKPTSKPDNAGGIAASVIVALLLIGTLVALLVFYLRTKPDANAPSLAVGISNEGYVTEDHVTDPPRQNHPMAAGFNNVSISAEVIKREEE
ncbi:apical endosomal glycoprotein isoform X2 [Poeciliopsis prolifica]|uniref:apical endosomal glycoprotein isoform X2 n=1 Tax=Poeciliopsis prolifica TaxID=188132 RepID=UPI0024136E9D|nr:apical endosomal glycoprotein isoform X2 [Poeciliopsis prolifica]